MGRTVKQARGLPADLKRLTISFSGGRTSAVMTKLLMESIPDCVEVVACFANTGWEYDETLDFVHRCDQHFQWDVVWLEAVIDPRKGVGPRHKVVDYHTAARAGEPFEAYIKKHGLPAPSHPHCTTRLKEDVMDSYRHRELGWKRGSYYTAIGIRADEMDRMSSKREKKKLLYPLAAMGWTKEDVKRECAKWPFDLSLPGDHYGNCKACYKKSLRKLMTLALDDPSAFDFAVRMGEEHRHTNITDPEVKDYRAMYRGDRTAVDILEMARTEKFEPYVDADFLKEGENPPSYDVLLDTGGSCGDSCEIGADD